MTDETAVTDSPEAAETQSAVPDATAEKTEVVMGNDSAGKETPTTDATTDEPQSEAKGAPDNYEAFQLPEGVEMDTDALGKFTEYARAVNLPQDKAQEAINLHTSLMQNYIEAQTEQQVQQVQAWYDEIKADKDLGGDKFEETQKVAGRAIEQFGSPELRQLLQDTGLGNNPELVRFVHRIGLALSEDSFGADLNSRGAISDPAELLYPSMRKSA